MVWAVFVKQPDILISGDAHNVAVRGRDGHLHLMRIAKDRVSRQGVAGG
jgi:competence protein ComEC